MTCREVLSLSGGFLNYLVTGWTFVIKIIANHVLQISICLHSLAKLHFFFAELESFNGSKLDINKIFADRKLDCNKIFRGPKLDANITFHGPKRATYKISRGPKFETKVLMDLNSTLNFSRTKTCLL